MTAAGAEAPQLPRRNAGRVLVRRTAVVVVLAIAVVAGLAASLALGAVDIPLATVIDALTGKADPGPLRQIVLDLRLPRTVEAVCVGAALGVAGGLLQGALANPLASPDVIGVTGGAGFGAVLILIVFPGSIALLPVGALFFGLLAAGLVFSIAWAGPNAGGAGRLILAGIAIAALFGAGMTSIMVAYPDRVQSALFFIAGGLTSDGWTDLKVVWPYFAAGFVLAICLARPLDRLALGDDVAASLGARPRMVRLLVRNRARHCSPPPRRRSPACSASSAWSCRTSCGWRRALRATPTCCPCRRSAAPPCCSRATRSRARCARRSSCRSGRSWS